MGFKDAIAAVGREDGNGVTATYAEYVAVTEETTKEDRRTTGKGAVGGK
jgi:hypothetical protein